MIRGFIAALLVRLLLRADWKRAEANGARPECRTCPYWYEGRCPTICLLQAVVDHVELDD